MPAPNKNAADYAKRKQRYITLYFEDEKIKKKLKRAAKLEHRTANQWFNLHVVPRIEEIIAKKFSELPDGVRKQILAELEAEEPKSPRGR